MIVVTHSPEAAVAMLDIEDTIVRTETLRQVFALAVNEKLKN